MDAREYDERIGREAMRLTRRVLLTHWLAFVAGVAVAFLSK
jgi:hypothetical protein